MASVIQITQWGDLNGSRLTQSYFFPALTFAHLALWAAAIRRRAAADSLRLGKLLDPLREFTPRRASIARSMRLRSSSSCLIIPVKFGMAGILAASVRNERRPIILMMSPYRGLRIGVLK